MGTLESIVSSEPAKDNSLPDSFNILGRSKTYNPFFVEPNLLTSPDLNIACTELLSKTNRQSETDDTRMIEIKLKCMDGTQATSKEDILPILTLP